MYTSHGYEFIAAVVVIIIIAYLSKYFELSRLAPKSVSKSVVAIFVGPHSQLKAAVVCLIRTRRFNMLVQIICCKEWCGM